MSAVDEKALDKWAANRGFVVAARFCSVLAVAIGGLATVIFVDMREDIKALRELSADIRVLKAEDVHTRYVLDDQGRRITRLEQKVFP